MSGLALTKMNWITDQNLVQEVLNELLLERPRRQQSVKIRPQKLRHEISTNIVSVAPPIRGSGTHMSSCGEMKTSLRLII